MGYSNARQDKKEGAALIDRHEADLLWEISRTPHLVHLTEQPRLCPCLDMVSAGDESARGGTRLMQPDFGVRMHGDGTTCI